MFYSNSLSATGIPLESLSNVTLSAIFFNSSLAFPIATAYPTTLNIDWSLRLSPKQITSDNEIFNFSHKALIPGRKVCSSSH